MSDRKALYGFLRRRECWVPTWRAILVTALLGAAVLAAMAHFAHPFLAVNDPRPGDLLVVEGWVPDYVLEEAVAEFQRHRYRALIVTGGPLENGSPLASYRSYAELGAATIQKLYPEVGPVEAVPAPPVEKDRTLTSAVVLKEWAKSQEKPIQRVNVISLGPHSRRTRLLFQRAFSQSAEIGIIAAEDRSYDAARWWRSSAGFRAVTGEAIAYAYAAIFFG